MRAIFEGGPLDGKENYEVPPGLRTFEVYSADIPPEVVEGVQHEEYFLPTRHVYALVAEVGVLGRYVYRGTR